MSSFVAVNSGKTEEPMLRISHMSGRKWTDCPAIAPSRKLLESANCDYLVASDLRW